MAKKFNEDVSNNYKSTVPSGRKSTDASNCYSSTVPHGKIDVDASNRIDRMDRADPDGK